MRIEFIDKGAIGHIIIRSPVWRLIGHKRAVNAALLNAPLSTIVRNEGFWIRKTVLTGPIISMLIAHKDAWNKVNS